MATGALGPSALLKNAAVAFAIRFSIHCVTDSIKLRCAPLYAVSVYVFVSSTGAKITLKSFCLIRAIALYKFNFAKYVIFFGKLVNLSFSAAKPITIVPPVISSLKYSGHLFAHFSLNTFDCL